MDLCIRLSCCPSYQRNCQVNYLLKLRQKVIDQKNLLRRKDSTNCGNHLGKWSPFELAMPQDLENRLNYSFTLPRQLLFCVVCFCVRWSLISNCTNDLFCIMCPLGVLQCLPQKIYLTSLSPNSV